MPSMTSCSTKVKPVSSARWATFSRLPVRKLSTATTSQLAREQRVAEVRTDEPRPAGDDRTRHQRPTPW